MGTTTKGIELPIEICHVVIDYLPMKSKKVCLSLEDTNLVFDVTWGKAYLIYEHCPFCNTKLHHYYIHERLTPWVEIENAKQKGRIILKKHICIV